MARPRINIWRTLVHDIFSSYKNSSRCRKRDNRPDAALPFPYAASSASGACARPAHMGALIIFVQHRQRPNASDRALKPSRSRRRKWSLGLRPAPAKPLKQNPPIYAVLDASFGQYTVHFPRESRANRSGVRAGWLGKAFGRKPLRRQLIQGCSSAAAPLPHAEVLSLRLVTMCKAVATPIVVRSGSQVPVAKPDQTLESIS